MTVIRLTRMGRNKTILQNRCNRFRKEGFRMDWINWLFQPSCWAKSIKIDEERYNYWLSVGAKPSEKVKELASK